MKKYFYLSGFIIIIALICVMKGTFNTNENNTYFTSLSEKVDVMSIQNHNEMVYVGTTDGLLVVKGNQTNFFLEPVELLYKMSFIRVIYPDRDNNLWIGGNEGLICIKSDNTQILYDQSSGFLPDNRVNTITQASDGSIWIGTWGGAVNLFVSNSSSVFYTESEGLLKNMVNVILEDSIGGIWFASYNVRGGGISYLKNGTFSYFNRDSGLVNINTTSMIIKDETTLWVGGGMFEIGGITVFKQHNNDWTIDSTIEKKEGLAGNKVRSMAKVGDTFYIGSEYDGLAIWKGRDSKEIYTVKNGLPNNEVKCYTLRDNLLFIGTKAGICYLELDKKSDV